MSPAYGILICLNADQSSAAALLGDSEMQGSSVYALTRHSSRLVSQFIPWALEWLNNTTLKASRN